MSAGNSGVKTHDDTVNKNEGIRQAAAAGATQSAIITAEIAFYRACVKSGLANNCGVEPFMQVLRTLGVGGQ
jgi:hypothetical protein